MSTAASIFGHDEYSRALYDNVRQCMLLNTDIAACTNELSTAKSTLPVAIIFTVLLTAAFVCLVCFLSAFTLFCVKERKRRHRRKRRRARKHRKRMARIAAITAAGGQMPMDVGELDVELDPTKKPSGTAVQGTSGAPGSAPGGQTDPAFAFGGKFGAGGVGPAGADDDDSSEEREKEKKKGKKKGGFAGMFGALVDGGDDDSEKKDKDKKDATGRDPTAKEDKEEKKGPGGVVGFMKKLAANLAPEEEEFAEPDAAGSVADMADAADGTDGTGAKSRLDEEEGKKYVAAKDRFEENAPANEQGGEAGKEGGQAAGVPNPAVASSPIVPAAKNAGVHSAYA